jgi:hypothetical protein
MVLVYYDGKDLKFFNLDLGRENIRLAEEYRRVRELAERIAEGKAKKREKGQKLCQEYICGKEYRGKG